MRMAAKKAKAKKSEAKKTTEEPCAEEHEHDESCGCAPEEELFAKNANRSFALFELWYEDLNKSVEEQVAPDVKKREMLFLTLSNAMMDMVMDILPEDLAAVVAENIDDYLAVTLVNKKYGIDLLKKFQEEFIAKQGDKFEDQEKLEKALNEFQEKYWTTKRKDLKNKTPNQAVEEALSEYEL